MRKSLRPLLKVIAVALFAATLTVASLAAGVFVGYREGFTVGRNTTSQEHFFLGYVRGFADCENGQPNDPSRHFPPRPAH